MNRKVPIYSVVGKLLPSIFASMVIVLGLMANPVSAGAILALYTFSDGSGASSETVPNSIASSLTDGDGVLSITSDTGVGNSAPSAFKSYTEMDGGSDDYFSFTLTANDGFELDLERLLIDVQRDQITGTKASDAHVTVTVKSSVDAFANPIVTSIITGNGGGFKTDLTIPGTPPFGVSFQDLSSIEFRIYVSDAGRVDAGKGFHLDNVELQGGVSPILVQNPEPTSLVLWSLLGVFGLSRARKGLRKSSI